MSEDASAPGQPTSTNTTDSTEDPLTKARLFTLADDGTWTEIGTGTVCIDEAEGLPPRILITSITDGEMLLSTPVCYDDIYSLHKETILVWNDPEIGRDMAASFNTMEGCRMIAGRIRTIQVGVAQIPGSDTPGSAPRRHSTGPASWAVVRENLPALANAFVDYPRKIADYVTERSTFFLELAELYEQCRRQTDTVGMDYIAAITIHLLSPPYNTDNIILAQLVGEQTVNSAIDIVQYAIGRKDPDTGFVSRAAREQRFRNPSLLPSELVGRIHFLDALQYLRDLIPLLLEEGDALGINPLSIFIVRLKFAVCHDAVSEPSIFTRCLSNPREHPPLELLPMIHEICTIVKGSIVPLEPKEEVMTACLDRGLVPYLGVAMQEATQQHGWESVARCCDCIAHCVIFAPNRTRGELLLDVIRHRLDGAPPHTPLLLQLFSCARAMTSPVALQSLDEAVTSVAAGFRQQNLSLNYSADIEPLRMTVIRFWSEGCIDNAVIRPPFPPWCANLDGRNLEDALAPRDEDPPLVTLCRNVTPTSQESVAVTPSRGRLSSSRPIECCSHHCARLISIFLAPDTVHPSMDLAFRRSNLVECVVALLREGNVTARLRSRYSTDFRCELFRLLGMLATSGLPEVRTRIIEADALQPCFDLLKAQRRNNVLRSSALHVISSIEQRLRLAVQVARPTLGLTGTPYCVPLSGGPLAKPEAIDTLIFEMALPGYVLNRYSEELLLLSDVLHGRLVATVAAAKEVAANGGPAPLIDAETQKQLNDDYAVLLAEFERDADAETLNAGERKSRKRPFAPTDQYDDDDDDVAPIFKMARAE